MIIGLLWMVTTSSSPVAQNDNRIDATREPPVHYEVIVRFINDNELLSCSVCFVPWSSDTPGHCTIVSHDSDRGIGMKTYVGHMFNVTCEVNNSTKPRSGYVPGALFGSFYIVGGKHNYNLMDILTLESREAAQNTLQNTGFVRVLTPNVCDDWSFDGK